jgi:hypothetical protein
MTMTIKVNDNELNCSLLLTRWEIFALQTEGRLEEWVAEFNPHFMCSFFPSPDYVYRSTWLQGKSHQYQLKLSGP